MNHKEIALVILIALSVIGMINLISILVDSQVRENPIKVQWYKWITIISIFILAFFCFSIISKKLFPTPDYEPVTEQLYRRSE